MSGGQAKPIAKIRREISNKKAVNRPFPQKSYTLKRKWDRRRD